MSATPLRPPLRTLQRAFDQLPQALTQRLGWSLSWALLLPLAARLPLPLLLQVALQLMALTIAMAGLLIPNDRALGAEGQGWRGFVAPLQRAPLPLLLLPLLIGSLSALAGLVFLLPGLLLLLAWSFSLPLLLDQGGEAWEAMAASTEMVRRHWQRLLPRLLLLWALSVLVALMGWWLLGLWLPLAVSLLQGLYRSAQG